ncbi:zinc protease [Duganella sp. CF402]|uniref:M16 family metallopeptidase n=1 Tax=unclassified Duganella TaxID=2636909 RepID=UPI0008B5D846|nr:MULTISPECIES: insulinase family protein [unclassified Duganella]RZT09584.1 zinc protease [Duganella sp. BK701]SEL51323.1 zinc protease [Duganella sp. CF402]
MINLRTLCGAVLLACTFPALADELKLSDKIPVGPQVKVGKLANGLTYYIQKNGRPEKKLELRLVVKAGSILEDEDQQGLAHFTEHMAFNGSTHFKRNELVSYLQSIGVKFGADLNAYTSFDETVYILPLPTDKKEIVEQGFQVLEDWAHGLSFNDEDIDSERGIVLEELRLGKGVDDRMNKIVLPKVLNGSRYAERMPIGKEDILKTFKYDAIKRFYRDWYRPDLMAVVAVGDIEPAEAQRLIEQHFNKLKNPAKPRPRDYAQIPERQDSEGIVFTDKEVSANTVYIRYPIQSWPAGDTIADYRQKLIEGMYSFILSQRMYELTQQANPPFLQGGSGMNKIVRGYRSFGAGAVLGKGGATPAINALVQEDQRARQYGFTASEVERAKKGMLRNYERMYNERDKSDSSGFASEYIRNFLEQESIPGTAAEYRYATELIPGITLQEVNAAARAAIPENQSKLVIYSGVEKPGVVQPKANELVAIAGAAEKIAVKPQEEKVYATQLMPSLPKAGRIVSETVNAKIGITELTLSNGVKVVLKPTDFNNDQVILGGLRYGGWSLLPDSDVFAAHYASSIVGQMGVLNYTPNDLVKVLAGKSVSSAASVSSLNESVGGSSGSSDVEALLQLVYLQMTQPRKDAAIYSAYVDRQRELAQNNLARPESVFADTVTATLYNNSPRVLRAAKPADFDQLALDRVLDIYNSRMSSARDFTFFVVGSFDVEKLKPLIATYLASLPVGEIPVAFKDEGVRPIKGVVKKEVHAGSEPKSTISLSFTGEVEYSRAERMRLQALVEVMNIKLIETLREKMGAMYSGGMSGAMNRIPYGNYAINASLPCAPENVDKVLAATFAEIEKIKQNGAEEVDLNKVKAAWIKNYRKGLRENGYWMASLQNAFFNNTNPEDILSYESRVNSMTVADLKLAAQRYFDTSNYLQVVLYPEK